MCLHLLTVINKNLSKCTNCNCLYYRGKPPVIPDEVTNEVSSELFSLINEANVDKNVTDKNMNQIAYLYHRKKAIAIIKYLILPKKYSLKLFLKIFLNKIMVVIIYSLIKVEITVANNTPAIPK